MAYKDNLILEDENILNADKFLYNFLVFAQTSECSRINHYKLVNASYELIKKLRSDNTNQIAFDFKFKKDKNKIICQDIDVAFARLANWKYVMGFNYSNECIYIVRMDIAEARKILKEMPKQEKKVCEQLYSEYKKQLDKRIDLQMEK